MTESITLHTLIKRVLDETDITDPREIAVKVAGMIPEHRVHQILVDALVADVRTVMGSRRNRAMSNALMSKPNRSAKVVGIRDWWSEMLAARVHVGSSRWVALGDCGDPELAFAEQERRADAERELQRADMYAQLRKLLRTYKVKTVADLPRDAVGGIAA